MTFIIQLHSQCVSSVQKVDLGGQNGYEKDQGVYGVAIRIEEIGAVFAYEC